MESDQEADPQSSDTNLMRNGAGSSSSWLERGGSLWRTACNGGGREFENAQRGEERKKRGRTLKNNDQNDARGIRDGLITRFIPNSKLIFPFMIYLFYRD